MSPDAVHFSPQPWSVFKIHFSIILPFMHRYSKWSVPSCLLDQNVHTRLISLCVIHLPSILFLFVSSHCQVYRVVHKLWSSSLCNLLRPPLSASSLTPNILDGTLSSNSLKLHYLLVWEAKFHTHLVHETTDSDTHN